MGTSSKISKRKPLVTVLAFFIVILILYSVMWMTHNWTPRLGLDLKGGTSITLTAQNSTGKGSVSQRSLELAKRIIQQRVDSLGVGEASVTTQGDRNLVVSVPNVQRDELVQMVGQTAQLSFRLVYKEDLNKPQVQPSQNPSASASQKAADKNNTPATIPPNAKVHTLPLAPNTDNKKKSTDDLLKWQPSMAEMQQFTAWECKDSFPDQPNQALFACDDAKQKKYLLGPVIIPGNQVKNSTYGIPQGQVKYQVNLQFNKEGQDAFFKVTSAIYKNPRPLNEFAIVLDSKVISTPAPEGPIPGDARITGGDLTASTSARLSNMLKYGALPLTFEISNVENISATLGADQLFGGIVAGIIGLALVVIFCFFYYHGLGIVVVGSLTMAALVTYACMVLLGPAMGFTLNLPAIAGAIVAVGLTGDSFVIFFERIRDELRDGKSLRTSIEMGWSKAKFTIIVADMVSLLSATVLFILAVGSVKGFAFTLGLTTLIDLAIVFFFTKPIMTFLGRTKFFGQGRRGSGLEATHMGVSQNSLIGTAQIHRKIKQTVKQSREAEEK